MQHNLLSLQFESHNLQLSAAKNKLVIHHMKKLLISTQKAARLTPKISVNYYLHNIIHVYDNLHLGS